MDDYDLDSEFDIEDEDFDEDDEEFDDDFNENEDEIEDDIEADDSLSDWELEEHGTLDGETDANLGLADYTGFGASVDLDKLSDEQRDVYEQAYLSGKDAADYRNKDCE